MCSVPCSVSALALRNPSARVMSTDTAGTLPSEGPALLSSPFCSREPLSSPPVLGAQMAQEGRLWAPLVHHCQLCLAGDEGISKGGTLHGQPFPCLLSDV